MHTETAIPIAPYGLMNSQPNLPNPTQEKVLDWVRNVRANPIQDTIPVLYLQGGVGSGKTRAFMSPVIDMLTEIPSIRILWGRQDFKDLKLSIMDKFFEIMPPELISRKSEQYHWYDIDTSEGKPGRIFFNDLKDLGGLGSQEFAVIVVTEAFQITEQAYWTLKRRCRQAGMPCMILLEGEPPNESHWLARITDPTYETFDPDIERWIVSTYENWKNLPKSYTGSLEHMPDSWKRKYLLGYCGFKPDGTPYYTGYREGIHTADLDWMPTKELICGWDFGFRHPACIITQIDLQDRWLWLREIIGTDITIDRFGDYVKSQINLYYPEANCIHYGDPAVIQHNDKSELTSWQILQNKGIEIHYRTSEYRLRKELIERKLATLVNGKPTLLVDRRYCKTANDGFLGGYHYPVLKDSQKYTQEMELPFKDGFYEHIMNAAEYIAVNLFQPISRKREKEQPLPNCDASNM